MILKSKILNEFVACIKSENCLMKALFQVHVCMCVCWVVARYFQKHWPRAVGGNEQEGTVKVRD